MTLANIVTMTLAANIFSAMRITAGGLSRDPF
jgi:hypothetical protein